MSFNMSGINPNFLDFSLELPELIEKHNRLVQEQHFKDELQRILSNHIKLQKEKSCICNGIKTHLWKCPLAVKCKSCNARLDLNYIQPHFHFCKLFPNLKLEQHSFNQFIYPMSPSYYTQKDKYNEIEFHINVNQFKNTNTAENMEDVFDFLRKFENKYKDILLNSDKKII